jgi:hypothetical protein
MKSVEPKFMIPPIVFFANIHRRRYTFPLAWFDGAQIYPDPTELLMNELHSKPTLDALAVLVTVDIRALPEHRKTETKRIVHTPFPAYV